MTYKTEIKYKKHVSKNNRPCDIFPMEIWNVIIQFGLYTWNMDDILILFACCKSMMKHFIKKLKFERDIDRVYCRRLITFKFFGRSIILTFEDAEKISKMTPEEKIKFERMGRRSGIGEIEYIDSTTNYQLKSYVEIYNINSERSILVYAKDKYGHLIICNKRKSIGELRKDGIRKSYATLYANSKKYSDFSEMRMVRVNEYALRTQKHITIKILLKQQPILDDSQLNVHLINRINMRKRKQLEMGNDVDLNIGSSHPCKKLIVSYNRKITADIIKDAKANKTIKNEKVRQKLVKQLTEQMEKNITTNYKYITSISGIIQEKEIQACEEIYNEMVKYHIKDKDSGYVDYDVKKLVGDILRKKDIIN